MQIYEIIPGKLFQSPRISDDLDEVIFKGIKIIIDCDGVEDLVDNRLVSYLYWPIQDADAPPQEQLDLIANFGVNAIAAGFTVLTHCGEGINRSGLVNARILMLLQKISGLEAIEIVRTGRPGALINQKFVTMLQNL